MPSLRDAGREGWPYLLVFGLLIFLMVAWRMDTLAPFYATALLLVINQLLRRHRFTLKTAGDLIVGVGRALAELTAVLLGVGLIVGAFSATGLAGTLVNELIFLAGNSTLALLLMGALTAFVFGMGMTVTACYIFLAVVLAPALEQAGLNQLAVHLFILYWGMVSYITPPVALGAFAAATMAGAGPMRTGLEAMRLGGVIYVAPFFFVLNLYIFHHRLILVFHYFSFRLYIPTALTGTRPFFYYLFIYVATASSHSLDYTFLFQDYFNDNLRFLIVFLLFDLTTIIPSL